MQSNKEIAMLWSNLIHAYSTHVLQYYIVPQSVRKYNHYLLTQFFLNFKDMEVLTSPV